MLWEPNYNWVLINCFWELHPARGPCLTPVLDCEAVPHVIKRTLEQRFIYSMRMHILQEKVPPWSHSLHGCKGLSTSPIKFLHFIWQWGLHMHYTFCHQCWWYNVYFVLRFREKAAFFCGGKHLSWICMKSSFHCSYHFKCCVFFPSLLPSKSHFNNRKIWSREFVSRACWLFLFYQSFMNTCPKCLRWMGTYCY